MTNWRAKSLEDLFRADEARREGNEGRARVCARRAAGWAASAFLDENKYADLRNSGFQNILQLAIYFEKDERIVALCDHLSASLEKDFPDDTSHLAPNIDLLADARDLILKLYPDFSENANSK